MTQRILTTGLSYTELVEAGLRLAPEFQTDVDGRGPNNRVARAMTILAASRGDPDSADE